MDSQSGYRKTPASFMGKPRKQITYGNQQQSTSKKIFRSCTVHNGIKVSIVIVHTVLRIFLDGTI